VVDTYGAKSSITLPVDTSNPSGQLLFNFNFETGTLYPWVAGFSPLLSNVLVDANAADAFDGTHAAIMTFGGGSYLSQRTWIPSGKTSATLVVHLRVTSDTTDTLTLELRKDTGLVINGETVLATLATFARPGATSGYLTLSYDLTPWIGQKVALDFHDTEPAKEPSTGNFLIDDVTLTVH